ncbi:MAG: hypothetical protein MJ187_00960 [Alphaproteobacteria bacterium]|nr:hypothetical protein [Alphaproteobacteria bacterium]
MYFHTDKQILLFNDVIHALLNKNVRVHETKIAGVKNSKIFELDKGKISVGYSDHRYFINTPAGQDFFEWLDPNFFGIWQAAELKTKKSDRIRNVLLNFFDDASLKNIVSECTDKKYLKMVAEESRDKFTNVQILVLSDVIRSLTDENAKARYEKIDGRVPKHIDNYLSGTLVWSAINLDGGISIKIIPDHKILIRTQSGEAIFDRKNRDLNMYILNAIGRKIALCHGNSISVNKDYLSVLSDNLRDERLRKVLEECLTNKKNLFDKSSVFKKSIDRVERLGVLKHSRLDDMIDYKKNTRI